MLFLRDCFLVACGKIVTMKCRNRTRRWNTSKLTSTKETVLLDVNLRRAYGHIGLWPECIIQISPGRNHSNARSEKLYFKNRLVLFKKAEVIKG